VEDPDFEVLTASSTALFTMVFDDEAEEPAFVGEKASPPRKAKDKIIAAENFIVYTLFYFSIRFFLDVLSTCTIVSNVDADCFM
jgi:hypothetical protein